MSEKAEKAGYERDAILRGADPGIALYIKELRGLYGQHDAPIEEVRRLVAESMNGTRLTDALYRMRNEDDVI